MCGAQRPAASSAQLQSYYAQVQEQLLDQGLLRSDAGGPDAPFDELKVLLPAREYKNRHASIMLCLDATLDAIDAAA